MNKEDLQIKPFIQILLGIGLLVFHKMLERPIDIVTKRVNSNWYDPSDVLFFNFLSWATLIISIFLIILGTAQLIKRLFFSK